MLEQALKETSEFINERMSEVLPDKVSGRIGENRLIKAMRYMALSGGKRLRPFLVLSSADLFGVSRYAASNVACAIECIHTYSLIHDDLPAMDDDDERRGKPSCHKEFDEATAILAGDAMLTYAFEILSDSSTHPDASVRAELVLAASRAVGIEGMVGGQMIDMLSEDRELNVDQITRLQRMKTGALFAVSCESGAIMGKASSQLRRALRAYANDIGLAFQIADDILDAESDNSDGRHDKSAEKGTYIQIMGLEKTRKQAEILVDQAVMHLKPFGKRADVLRELAQFMISREY